MSKTQDELKELKEEYKRLNEKLKELTEDELKKVVGGNYHYMPVGAGGHVEPDDSCPLCERCADCSWYGDNGEFITYCSKPRKG